MGDPRRPIRFDVGVVIERSGSDCSAGDVATRFIQHLSKYGFADGISQLHVSNSLFKKVEVRIEPSLDNPCIVSPEDAVLEIYKSIFSVIAAALTAMLECEVATVGIDVDISTDNHYWLGVIALSTPVGITPKEPGRIRIHLYKGHITAYIPNKSLDIHIGSEADKNWLLHCIKKLLDFGSLPNTVKWWLNYAEIPDVYKNCAETWSFAELAACIFLESLSKCYTSRGTRQ